MSSPPGPESHADATPPEVEVVRDYERKLLEYGQEHARHLLEGAPPKDAPPSPPHDLCGLALSGGGIRSATFNLGLLQGLHQMGLLKLFAYLATVSGGGYIGSFWTAWRHYQNTQGNREARFPENEKGARGIRVPEVRDLREFSNFLIPRLGLTSIDTGRVVVALLCAVLPALLAALSLIALVLLGWWGLARVLFNTSPLVSSPLLFLLTLGWLELSEWSYLRTRASLEKARRRALEVRRKQTPPQEKPGKWLRARYHLAALLASGLALTLWGLLLQEEALSGFSPSVAFLATAGVFVMWRWVVSRFAGYAPEHPEKAPPAEGRPLTERLISRLVLLAFVWAVLTAFWFAGWYLVENLRARGPDFLFSTQVGLAGTVVALATWFARVQQLLGRRTSEPVSPNQLQRVKTRLPQLLAYVTLALLVLGVVLLLLGPTGTVRPERLVLSAMVAGVLTLLTLLFFDARYMGLHPFYRSRLARAFIGAAHGKAPRQTEPHPEDDIRLDQLKYETNPLHLICCAANDLATEDPMATLYRGADSAVLSNLGYSVGWENTRWKPHETGERVPTLAAAMTASGAAFNSHMGSMSMRLGPAVTFLMTALDLRLGLWWPHPSRASRSWLRRLLVGLPFYEELLGLSRARSSNVLLSDGGHFENLALYELVRRRCRFILVSDCGMDADTSFSDFANAVRRVREDFGVEIRIDTSPLRPGPDGLSRQATVAGEIEYPDGDTGVLLLLKPTLLGNEPPDILQYKASNAAFPHESTGDQFYDEAQWEAYRRLGEHSALSAFRPVLGKLGQAESPRTAQLFAHARHQWLPPPIGYAERFSRFVERATSLDLLLHDPSARKLFREVFREIPELDKYAKEQQRGQQEPRREGEASGPASEAGPGTNGAPSLHDMEESLHIIRRGLLLMEEFFLSEELDSHYNHPAYLGLVNYFARWAYAPQFRMWWPLLKTQCSPRFTRFLEKRFGLPGMQRKDVGRLTEAAEGFAMSCWLAQGGHPPREELGEQLISYELALPHGGRPRYHVQAAQLIVRSYLLEDGDGETPARTGPRILAWQGDDFFVPPGLWGAGIGEDFLHLLTSDPYPQHAFKLGEQGALLAVRLRVNLDYPAMRRKRWADDLQLYRSHRFEEPQGESRLERELHTRLEADFNNHPALHWQEGDRRWQSRWLVRRFTPGQEQDFRERRPGAPAPEEAPLHH